MCKGTELFQSCDVKAKKVSAQKYVIPREFGSMSEIHCSLKTTLVATNISGHCYEFKKELQSNKKWCYYF